MNTTLMGLERDVIRSGDTQKWVIYESERRTKGTMYCLSIALHTCIKNKGYFPSENLGPGFYHCLDWQHDVSCCKDSN